MSGVHRSARILGGQGKCAELAVGVHWPGLFHTSAREVVRISYRLMWAPSDRRCRAQVRETDFLCKPSSMSMGSCPVAAGPRLSSRSTRTARTRLPRTLRRVLGSGDLWFTEQVGDYGGQIFHGCSVFELEAGKIVRETDHFGEPFEAPSWRSPFADTDALELVHPPVASPIPAPATNSLTYSRRAPRQARTTTRRGHA